MVRDAITTLVVHKLIFQQPNSLKSNAYTTMPFWTHSDGPIGVCKKHIISLRDRISFGLG